MHPLRVVGVATLVLLHAATAAAQPSQFRRSPPFEGDRLPTPPQQSAPWTPPETDFGEKFLSAIELLCEQGFADPRGCEYREIEVGTGSCWSGDDGVVATHGWVLPVEDGEPPRFAVCWNGLVYPLVSAGQPCSVDDDVAALLAADKAIREKHKQEKPDQPFTRWRRRVVPERFLVSHESMLPIKVVPLMLLGKAAPAQDLYSAALLGDLIARQGFVDQDPYLSLAKDWAWAAFDRSVCAHMRGDDKLALCSAEQLFAAWQAVQRAAGPRGYPPPRRPGGRFDQEQPYLAFVAPIEVLLADQRRRAAQPDRVSDGSIAALIADLEEVNARQMGQPGGVGLGMDPRIGALVKLGDEAIHPLLKCLESDTRLTRSVSFHRDFFENRNLIPVQTAAYVALSRILKKSFTSPQGGGGYVSTYSEEGRRELAKRIRAHLARFEGAPLVDQWYTTLAADGASPDEWLEAAKNIVSRAGSWWPSDGEREGEWVVWKKGQGGLPGEALRSRSDPSVTDLMTRRLELLVSKGEDRDGRSLLLKARTLSQYLAVWDPDAAGPVQSDLARRAIRVFDGARGLKRSATLMEYAAELIGAATNLSATAGDTQVLPDYGVWLQGCTPEELGDAIGAALAPLWRFADDPAMAATAEWLFSGESSAWNPLIRPDEGSHDVESLFETPLIAVPAFREQALRMLHDQRIVGRVEATAADRFRLVRPNTSQSFSTYAGDPLAPAKGQQHDIRLGDVYADLLSRLPGAPGFAYFWPEPKRDQAISQIEAFFRRYGGSYRGSRPKLGSASAYRWRGDDPRLRIPQRETPATPEEVAQGTAIFSLGGDRPTRVWELPKHPMQATWVAKRSELRPGEEPDPNSKRVLSENLHVRGQLWQAEEVLENGEWRRYLGFVTEKIYRGDARHGGVYKLPAEQVRLGSNSQDLTLLLETAWFVSTPSETRRKILRVGDPLVVACSLRNNRAVAQEAPAASPARSGVSQEGSGAGPALPPGVKLKLTYQAASGKAALRPDLGGDWQEIPAARSGATDEAAPPRAALQPHEQARLGEADLRDWFDVGRAGHYRLEVSIDSERLSLPSASTATIAFTIEASD